MQTKIPVKVIDTLYRTNLNWEKLKGYPAANPELSFDQLKLYLDGRLKNIPIQIANLCSDCLISFSDDTWLISSRPEDDNAQDHG